MAPKWPQFIVSTSRRVSMVCNNQETPLEVGSGMPFYGITWCSSFLYINVSSDRVVNNRDQILILNENLNPCGTLPGIFPSSHQTFCDDGSLYITVTSRNAIAKVDLLSRQERFYNWTGTDEDKNHINCICKDGDGFWVGYHNYVEKDTNSNTFSRIILIDRELTNIMRSIDIGVGVHNCCRIGNKLYITSSLENSLLEYDLDSDSVSRSLGDLGWVRGMGATESYFVLGGTAFNEDRSLRHNGDGIVYLVDRDSFTVVDMMLLNDSGSVYEIRLTGGEDYAHNGIYFPGRI